MSRTADGTEMPPLAVTPDLAAARTWMAVMRRIDRVTISVCDGTADAHLDGVVHRLPVRRRIQVGAALGLRQLHVPTVLEAR